MTDGWLPKHDRTRTTQNGSTVSFLDHELFQKIGAKAHALGDLRRHAEPSAFEQSQLDKMVDELNAGLELSDAFHVEAAVAGYVRVAATHAEGSAICLSHPGHPDAAILSEGELYRESGLRADLIRVCP